MATIIASAIAVVNHFDEKETAHEAVHEPVVEIGSHPDTKQQLTDCTDTAPVIVEPENTNILSMQKIDSIRMDRDRFWMRMQNTKQARRNR